MSDAPDPFLRPVALVGDRQFTGLTHVAVLCMAHRGTSACTPCGKHESGQGWPRFQSLPEAQDLATVIGKVSCEFCAPYLRGYLGSQSPATPQPEQEMTISKAHAARWQILQQVLDERNRQEAQWGLDHDAGHSYVEWTTLAADYLGRASRAALDGPTTEYRKRLLQMIAVGVAALEADLLQQDRYVPVIAPPPNPPPAPWR